MSAIPHIGKTVRQRLVVRPLQQVNETQPEAAQFCAVVDEPVRSAAFWWVADFLKVAAALGGWLACGYIGMIGIDHFAAWIMGVKP